MCVGPLLDLLVRIVTCDHPIDALDFVPCQDGSLARTGH